jgi:hypothetical protein
MEDWMTAVSKARLLSAAPAILGVVLAITLGAFSAISPAKADPIPQDSLEAQQGACMKSCAAAKASTAVCTTYCGCIRQQISATMSMEDLMELEQAMKDGKALPQDPNEKLQNAVKICRGQVSQ